jgi:hypothetical protein
MNLSLKDYDFYADQEKRWTVPKLARQGYLTGVGRVSK